MSNTEQEGIHMHHKEENQDVITADEAVRLSLRKTLDLCINPLDYNFPRHDLSSKHEEIDILITQHAISASLSGSSVRVVCDDTDVFVLLVHFYNCKCKDTNAAPMIM